MSSKAEITCLNQKLIKQNVNEIRWLKKLEMQWLCVTILCISPAAAAAAAAVTEIADGAVGAPHFVGFSCTLRFTPLKCPPCSSTVLTMRSFSRSSSYKQEPGNRFNSRDISHSLVM